MPKTRDLFPSTQPEPQFSNPKNQNVVCHNSTGFMDPGGCEPAPSKAFLEAKHQDEIEEMQSVDRDRTYDPRIVPLKGFPDDLLIINDIILSDVPTTAIGLDFNDNTEVYETLRSKSPTVKPFGHQDVVLNLSLAFAPGPPQALLHKLVAQLRRHPLCYIFNNYIRSAILGTGNASIGSDVNTIFILEFGELKSTNDTVGTIVLNLTFHYFNYLPFTNHFWYNARLGGVTSSFVSKEETNVTIDTLSGYQPSAFAIDKYARQVMQDVEKTIKQARELKHNVPINFPHLSDCWNYFARHLESLTPSIPSRTSDFVGLTAKIYRYITPPGEAKTNRFGYESIFNSKDERESVISPMYAAETWKDVVPGNPPLPMSFAQTGFGNRNAEMYGYNSQGARDEFVGPPAPGTSTDTTPLSFKKTGIRWLDSRNKILEQGGLQAWKTANGLVQGAQLSSDLNPSNSGKDLYSYSGSSKCNILFCETLKRAGYKTPDMLRPDKKTYGYPKPEGIISAVRNGGMWKNGLKPNEVVFIRLSGKSLQEIQSVIDAGVPVGISYKNDKTQHVGVVGKILSINNPNGEISSARVVLFDQNSINGKVMLVSNSAIEIFQAVPKGTIAKASIKPIERASDVILRKDIADANPNPAAKKIENKQKIKEKKSESAKQEIKESVSESENFVDIEDVNTSTDSMKRSEWISSLMKEEWYEHIDPKLRNIFYSTVGNEIKISSSPSVSDGDSTYGKDIVCSAISASFGHRIVPIKLASHPRYTWQFLGGGNRSGSLVFTFKGANGRYAANRIKELIRLAKENGAAYQGLVPTSGSITLNSYNFETEEQNTILRLLDVRDVVVTDISENAIPGMQDVYQMVVNFIVQEFQPEGLEQKLFTNWDARKTIINTLTSDNFVTYIENTTPKLLSTTDSPTKYWGDKRRYIPNPSIIKRNPNKEIETIALAAGSFIGNQGGSWIFTNRSFPSWLAQTIGNTVDLLNETNERMPPIDWKISPGERKTWRDRYKSLVGNPNLFRGMVKNISPKDVNQNSYGNGTTSYRQEVPPKREDVEQNNGEIDLTTSDSSNRIRYSEKAYKEAEKEVLNQEEGFNSETQRNILDMARGNFQNNGGSATNAIHEIVFQDFSFRLANIVRELQSYMSDPEFQKYFPGVTANIIDAISKQFNVCYDDMDMPKIPGGTVNLAPEFYVYDDSGENTLAIQNDKDKLTKLVELYRRNSQNSILHYLTKNYLGGRYVSKSLPLALYAKGMYDKYNESENQMFDPKESWNMLKWGTQAWDPVYYRNNESGKETKMQEWIDHTSKGLLGQPLNRVSTDSKFLFVDNMIKLSPFLREEQNPLFYQMKQENFKLGEEDMVNAVYGENWRAMSMGPNQQSALVDAASSGTPVSEQEKARILKRYGDWADRQRDILSAALESGSWRQIRAAREISKRETPPPVTINVQGGTTTVSSPELTADQILAGGLAKAMVEYKKTGENLSVSEMMSLGWSYLGGKVLESETAMDIMIMGQDIEEVVSNWLPEAAGVFAGGIAAITGNPFLVAGAAGMATAIVDKLVGSKTKEEENKEKRASQVDFSNAINDTTKSIIESKGDGIHADISVASAMGTRTKDISIRRVYPAFRIYFIEEDEQDSYSMNGEIVRAFDDFYSYSAIQEIRVIRSRKIAADLAIIRMTNVSGTLLRKRFGDIENRDKSREDDTGIFAETEKENPFWKLLLTEGVKVQIRLGYDSNPDQLEIPFLGQIVEIAPSEDGKIIEIMCQGYGAELEAVELGDEKESPIFYSSTEALSAAIIQDHIVHFGRRKRDDQVNPAEARHAFFGGGGESSLWSEVKNIINFQSPGDIYQAWGTNKLYQHHFRYQFLNEPQDDNIYAPPPWIYMPDRITWFAGACEYTPNRQTTWEIFKEHELRHPGYVSLAVPYGNSGRMTMFFGSRSQYYWANPPSSMETFLANSASNLLISMRNWSNAIDSQAAAKDIKKLAEQYPDLAQAIVNGVVSVGPPTGPAKEIGKIMGRYRPFVNYHYLDSYHHIIENKIKTSIDGTFNQLDFSYTDQTCIDSMTQYSSKLDQNIPPEDVRSYQDSFKSCVSEYMAVRYSIGLFVRFLKDCYKGELIVIGDASIKPYDVCIINDAANAMSGPIEVQQVEHIVSAEHGFITIITPDMCVDGNDYLSGMVIGQMAFILPMLFAHSNETEDYCDYDSNKTLMLPSSSFRGPMQLLGMHAALKLMNFTNNGCPVVATPLVYEGKPFIPVIFGPKTCSVFTTLGGKWEQWWDDLDKGWKHTDVGEDVWEMYQDWKSGFFASAANLPRANQSLAPAEPNGGGQ